MKEYDAIVIGSGPAGSCASALLAEKGHKILVLEREKFPRYHIGESLLPFTHEPLKRLGVIDKLRDAKFVKKYSVQLWVQSGKQSLPFYFSTRYDMDIAQTWQVLRSEFDQILQNNAREKGAEVIEEMTVREFLKDSERVVGVKAIDKQGKWHEYRAPITLDCTGRESLAASRHDWRVKDPSLNKVAVWTYYKGAKRDPGIDEGATTVAYVKDKAGSGTSAAQRHAERRRRADGNTCSATARAIRRKSSTGSAGNKWIIEHLAEGQQVGPYFTTGEYSYRSKFAAIEGLVLVGDAYGFLDPVFSSGVMLALKSGMLAADTVDGCIRKKDFSTQNFTEYARTMKQGIENMRRLVYAFYDLNFSFRKVTDKYPETAGLFTDCLSGDVNKDFSWLFEKCAELAQIPDDLPCGNVLVKSA
ncbi:NAD(P)/FAD-dependent oxidoreductase [Oscillatoria laete-virens NRMC-F 0139]|nr:NAD(P)/FAD-dependent oxidoreductase [Oscillatoria laete-virens]MDL5055697.1 NAD(P)/FAD-dependent oxidoreductase [Oscillatoria laete-virens NRMC-F 0139]